MQPLHILFITDPLAHFKIAKDSTYAMMQAAAEHGHVLYMCESHQLTLDDNQVYACATPLTLITPTDSHWVQLAETQMMPLQNFDAVLMRKDPPFDMEYITATWLLSHAQRQGAKVFNDPAALRDHSEKLAIAEFPQFTPPTMVSHSLAQLRAFHQKYHDIILKPLDGMGGAGVFRVKQDGLNLSAIIETLGQQGTRNLMAQQFIPEIQQGDKRVLLIAGQVIPFALARIPAPGEVRGNLAVGGTGIAQPLTARDLDIAQTLAPILWQRGILIAGIDIIGPYLTEINITSPTCFREIQQQTQADAAAMTLTALEKICQNAL
jgi:glutathione synthase